MKVDYMINKWVVALIFSVSTSALAASLSVPVDALIERGAYLAKAGDCVACHTAPRGAPFAGGLQIATPIGHIYSTNITPDQTTGIGRWTLAEFDRAVRRGISKDGHNLYPAMPYPSYAKYATTTLRLCMLFQ